MTTLSNKRYVTFSSILCTASLGVFAVGSGCSEAPSYLAGAEQVGEADEHLTPEQCNYFDVNGTVRICHHTGSSRHPYTILNISDQGCINAHAGHALDYVAVNDPTCQGGGCLPQNAPCDATLPCCGDAMCINGTCQDLCAGVTCAASDQCHLAGTCDPNTGLCSNPVAPSGTGCDDGDACTQPDTCDAGVCASGNPVTCTASDECHVAGSCDSSSGVCSNPDAPDGIYCSTGICKTGACYTPTLSFQANQDYAVGSRPQGVAAGDVNGDGKPDLVVINVSSADASVLLGNGDGTLTAAGTVSGIGTNPGGVALADLDGDGRLDLLVGGFNVPGIGGLRVLLGNGDGTFQPATLYVVGNQPTAVQVADFNGDGKLDVVTANFVGSSLSVLLGNGDGTLQPAVNYAAVGANTPNDVAVADVNGDGKLDLVSANFNSNNLSVWLGNGDGTFQPAIVFPSGGSGVGAVAVADLNGDGKPDIAAAHQNSANVTVLLGNGDGTFQAPVVHAVGGSFVVDVAIADFNGDLRLDIAATSFNNHAVGVLLGDGAGAFQPVTLVPVGNNRPYGLAEVDLNGDGKLDIATTNLFENNVSVLINQSF
ncbi:FG-GAP repeat domain-containing protein [Sorangium sp. So ce131]|uniref:FG-GAP repeat domain-containing protein n=1 Tax=Sorangium sp. So ce131 TaxID=3133282 RepID=UPI003F5F2490